jgi:hypothetical protein
MTTAVEIGAFWHRTSRKINFISASFSPLCVRAGRDFGAIFLGEVAGLLAEDPDLSRGISQIIIEGYDEVHESGDVAGILPAFQFVKDSGQFDSLFLPMFTKSVTHFLTPIINDLFQHKLSEYLTAAVKIEERELALASLWITDYAKRELTKALHFLIFKSKFTSICENRLKLVIEEHDTKTVSLLVRFARATDTIEAFTREFSFEFEAAAESCFKQECPIHELMNVHSALTDFCAESFNPQDARLLRKALEKGLNTSPDLAARLLAEQIDREFVNRLYVGRSTFEQLIAIFRMLNAKDVFEAYHHLLLSRRILMLKHRVATSDEIFLNELTIQCGPDYVRRFTIIFDDFQQSLDVLEKFKATIQSPALFRALVLSKAVWPNVDPKCGSVPASLQPLLSSFAEFYHSQFMNRRLQWNLEFARVKLSVRDGNSLKKFRCNGIVAVVLLALADAPLMGINEISKATNLESGDVEEVLKLLMSKRAGKLIVFTHRQYRVNVNISTNNEEVSIPLGFPTLPQTEACTTSTIENNRGSQVDAAAMMLMKQEKSMEKEELKRRLKEIVPFRLDEELFEKRMARLAQILYLKLDQSGMVHYLP